MLNTFLIRHDSGHIQALDDLEIHKEWETCRWKIARTPWFYRIGETVPAFSTMDMMKVSEAVREVSPGFRSLLQKVDDEIEALQNRREDMLIAAFEDGLQLSVDELNDFVAGDDDDDDAVD